MAGLVWFVQVVHYPLLLRVPEAQRAIYARAHADRTTLVVGLLMPFEAVTAVWLLAAPPARVPTVLPIVGVALLAAIWVSTALVQVHQHRALAARPTDDLVRALVRWNWPRTLLWSARAALASAMAISA